MTNPILLACIPGTLCNGRAFDPLVRELEGHGLSIRKIVVDTSQATTVRAVAEAGLAQLDPQPGERIVIAGFSLGGFVAIEMASLGHPKVAGLLLLDLNGEADPPDNAVRRRAMVERARASGVDAFVLAETWPTHVVAARVGDEGLRSEVLRMAEECGIEAFANQAEVAISRPRALDTATSLDVPTLVLCGAEDKITPPQMARAVADAVAGARFELIERAGHFAILERPDAIADIVSGWVAEID